MSSTTKEDTPPSSCCENQLTVRKADMQDVANLLRLINSYAAKGIMLPRTEFEMAENIRDFTVVCTGDRLAGCGALHFYTPDTAEVRSLAVDPDLARTGVGSRLMEALEAEAHEFGLGSLFAFTYVPDFFRKHGFVEVDRGALPLKAWKDCLRCAKFQCCDEIAVIKTLSPQAERGITTRMCGLPITQESARNSDPRLALLPPAC